MSAAVLERDLARVVELTRAAPRVRPLPVDPAAPPGTRLERARRELTRVQRAELALLLRRAVALRRADGADPALADGLCEALTLAEDDGRPWPRALERLALRLARAPRAAWPSELRLARVAHALWPCLSARVLVADALAAEGRVHAAVGELAGALVRLPRPARPAHLVDALARQLARVRAAGCEPRLTRACARLERSLAAERVA